jgi:hypothetical protein
MPGFKPAIPLYAKKKRITVESLLARFVSFLSTFTNLNLFQIEKVSAFFNEKNIQKLYSAESFE